MNFEANYDYDSSGNLAGINSAEILKNLLPPDCKTKLEVDPQHSDLFPAVVAMGWLEELDPKSRITHFSLTPRIDTPEPIYTLDKSIVVAGKYWMGLSPVDLVRKNGVWFPQKPADQIAAERKIEAEKKTKKEALRDAEERKRYAEFPADPDEYKITFLGKMREIILGKLYLRRINRDKIRKVIDLFGDNLRVTESNYFTVLKHLEDLSLIPETLTRRMIARGLKMRIGYYDILPFYKQNNGDKDKNVAAFYADKSRVGYAGDRPNVALHEFGHGVEGIMGFDLMLVKETHKRLYPKLKSHARQKDPGCYSGMRELMAFSFADYFQLSKEEFIKKYDTDWYTYFHGFLKPHLDNQIEN